MTTGEIQMKANRRESNKSRTINSLTIVVALSICVFFSVFSPACIAEIVTLKSGEVITGKIVWETDKKIIVEPAGGKPRTIDRSEIQSIEKDKPPASPKPPVEVVPPKTIEPPPVVPPAPPTAKISPKPEPPSPPRTPQNPEPAKPPPDNPAARARVLQPFVEFEKEFLEALAARNFQLAKNLALDAAENPALAPFKARSTAFAEAAQRLEKCWAALPATLASLKGRPIVAGGITGALADVNGSQLVLEKTVGDEASAIIAVPLDKLTAEEVAAILAAAQSEGLNAAWFLFAAGKYSQAMERLADLEKKGVEVAAARRAMHWLVNDAHEAAALRLLNEMRDFAGKQQWVEARARGKLLLSRYAFTEIIQAARPELLSFVEDSVKGKLYVVCDDRAELFLNDELVAATRTYLQVVAQEVTLREGDWLKVKCGNLTDQKGFGLVFVSERGDVSFSTRAAEWRYYTPDNPREWLALPAQNLDSLPLANKGNAEESLKALNKISPKRCDESVWGDLDKHDAYLVKQITLSDLMPRGRVSAKIDPPRPNQTPMVKAPDAPPPPTEKPREVAPQRPAEPPPSPQQSQRLEQALEAAMERVKQRFGNDYSYRREGVFICVGAMPQEALDTVVDNIIKDVGNRFGKMFFDKKPNYPIHVYLANSRETFGTLCRKLGVGMSSPAGFYTPATHTLMINLGTGDGTLVHELVHALQWPDFRDCPLWFFEGFGSLFEMSAKQGSDEIVGKKNWRYAELIKTLRENRLTPLRRLMTMDNAAFRSRVSLHYAQARYLCMYLQEKGVLKQFYKEFRDNFSSDRTGLKTLEKIFGKSAEEVEKDWLAWVVSLENVPIR
jgi:hypothetical protein